MISVIAFHAGITAISGGYVGVDIFFVISGYLITALIFKEMENGTFTFLNFYKRRAARLLPALIITIFTVFIFGFIFYNTATFDNLGKEIAFSSIGAANILFANGVNYFVKDEAYQPLIHLWSLGVEEQFYLIWPLILLITIKIHKKSVIAIAALLFFASLTLSIDAVNNNLTKGYFLLHYRAFELLIGVITALVLYKSDPSRLSDNTKKLLSYVGFTLIITPMLLLDKESAFPGMNALWTCLGAALVIAFPNSGSVTKLLSNKTLVFLGLISYPLYLYHQPLISFIKFSGMQLSSFGIFSFVLLLLVPASWLTYKYLEKPIRQSVHAKQPVKSWIMLSGMILTIPVFAAAGLFVAKSGGFEARFKYLNPFALEITAAHSNTFIKKFSEGYQVNLNKKSRALFVGDSVLQHYVVPILTALNLKADEIDLVTRGGCVLLKGADFKDNFASISCNSLREDLYKINKKYDYVIISQAWEHYDKSVLNFAHNTNGYSKWSDLLNNTIAHFAGMADKIILIGAHPLIDGTKSLQPSVTSSKDRFTAKLNDLKIVNYEKMMASRPFFDEYAKKENIIFIEPYRIFCDTACKLSDGQWSYFADSQHLSGASTEFVSARILASLSEHPL